MAKHWITAQLGAREHYAIARSLHQNGLLRRLYTDIWIPGPRTETFASYAPGSMRRLLGRFHPDIPNELVTAFNWQGMVHATKRHLYPARTFTNTWDGYMRIGRRFAERVSKSIAQQVDKDGLGFVGYTNTSLEVMRRLVGKGVPCILSQIDAAKLHEDVLSEEAIKWPSWSRARGTRPPHQYWERIEEEWSLARTVVVNSEWTKHALVAQGLEEEKIAVVPLAYDPVPQVSGRPRQGSVGANVLRVLFLGSVTLAKGVPYLLRAADMLSQEQIKFTIAGPLNECPSGALHQPRANVTWSGAIPRADVPSLYDNADVFVFPTLSDGFGITQLEAMAHGLPVVTTDRCGRVVSPGRDGFVVPAADANALAAAIRKFMSLETLGVMSDNARAKARLYTMERYAKKLVPVLLSDSSTC